MTRRSVSLCLATAVTAAAVALPIASGSAQTAPRTLTVTYVKPQNVFLDDAAPRTLKRGRLTIGDRIVGVQGARVDGKAGTLHTDTVVTNRVPTGFSGFTAILHSVLKTGDGALYAEGFVDSANGGDRSAIVGGTGVYANARGSIVGSENGAVITLEP
jgi:hypothetical protein